MTYLSLTWRPRAYYIMRNKTSGKLYLGQTTQDITRYRGSGAHWKNHCKKNGGYNKKNIEVIWSHFFICEKSAQMWLDQFALDNPNYDSPLNEEWANQCLETTEDSPLMGGEISRKITKKRLEDGTHNLLGENNPSHERVANNTHNWQGNTEWHREKTLRQTKEGRNAFVGGKMQRDTQNALVENGTHHLLNNVSCYDKNGFFARIPSEIYHDDKNSGKTDEQRDYVHVNTLEGKRRKLLLQAT